MGSAFPAFSSSLFLLLIFCGFSIARSSTVGVDHISRVLEIQDRESASPLVQVAAAQGVLRRLLPSHSSSFEFKIVSKERCGGKSCFSISNHPSSRTKGAPEIQIGGVSGVELSAGLHWYLKYWCGAHISWDKTGGAQLSSVPKPGFLPRVQAAGVLIHRPVPWNYYQNAVTSSYTFAWWDWERWEKEIDWMALQGINLPLAFTGQESIWQKVFQMEDRALCRFASNMFTVEGDPRWCCTYLLDATDPLFDEIGKTFIEQQLKEYGRSGHIYNWYKYPFFNLLLNTSYLYHLLYLSYLENRSLNME